LVWKEINYAHMRPVEKQRIADEVGREGRKTGWDGGLLRISG
jgi:hypothetical protein